MAHTLQIERKDAARSNRFDGKMEEFADLLKDTGTGRIARAGLGRNLNSIVHRPHSGSFREAAESMTTAGRTSRAATHANAIAVLISYTSFLS